MNVVRCSINETIKLFVAIGLPLEFVLHILKILGRAGCIGVDFEWKQRLNDFAEFVGSMNVFRTSHQLTCFLLSIKSFFSLADSFILFS